MRSTIREFNSARGFTLIENLIATTVLVAGVTALAGLAALATRANASARGATFASLLATQKLEQLRAGAWPSVSPSDSLVQNTSGYSDFVDAAGASLGGGTLPPAGAVFVRRWSIAPLPSNPANAVVLQVAVLRVWRPSSGALRVLPDEAAFATVRTRRGT